MLVALLYLIPYPFLKIFTFSLRRARAARGPYFLLLQKVGKDRPKRAAPPLGFPLRSRWRGLRPQFARGNSGTPRRFAAGASAQICEGVAAKAVSNAVPCAFAHDRRTFPNGEPWGLGGAAPKRSGGGAAAVASAYALAAFPNGTEAPAAQRLGVRPGLPRQRGLGGFQRGASSTPLWSGNSQGGETPLRLSFAYFSAGAEK